MKTCYRPFLGLGMLLCLSLACRALVPAEAIETPSLPTSSSLSSPIPAATLSPALIPSEPAPQTEVPPTPASPTGAQPTTASSSVVTTITRPLSPYAVILVKPGDQLNVRSAPGADQPIVARLPADASGVVLAGQEADVAGQRWVQISHPSRGWVNAYYLTEQITPTDFCKDGDVLDLIESLEKALTNRDGDLFASLVSPDHGMNLIYYRTGNQVNYSPAEAGWLFKSDYVTNWGIHPASGMEVSGTFRDEVLPMLDDVFSSDYELRCSDPTLGPNSYIFQWPEEYKNISFYSVHKPGSPEIELDWRTWLVGVEYVDEKPYLFALLHLFWEP